MAANVKYYLLHDVKRLARVEDRGHLQGYIFRDGEWHKDHSVAMKVTGLGGDSDFDEISEKRAMAGFPDAF